MKKRLLFSLAIVAFGAGAFLLEGRPVAQPSSFDPLQTRLLYADCTVDPKSTDMQKQGSLLACYAFMRGLVVGIFGLQHWNDGRAPLCLPTDNPIDPELARKLFVDYVKQHPELMGTVIRSSSEHDCAWTLYLPMMGGRCELPRDRERQTGLAAY